MIKEISIEDLRTVSVELLSRTFLELRQNLSEDDIVTLSLILADDLKKDFSNMKIEDIKESFRLGIRNTDDFLIGPKVWYKWIKKHRQIIWDNESVEEQYRDKRLSYRNAGIKSISSTIKNLKMIGNERK